MKRYSPFRHIGSIFRKNTPLQLTLFLTRRCNAACPFCFYLNNARPDAGKELSTTEIEKISASLGNLLWLAFSGGEIFLRRDLVEITTIFYRRNRPAIILLPTNGLLPEIIYQQTESILKKCPKSTVVVKLSLDGPEKTHDSLRGVNGAWHRVLKCYAGLTRLLGRYDNFELGINTVFCTENQEIMPEIIKMVADLPQIKTHTVSMIRGKVAAEELKKINLEKYQDTIDLLAANLKREGAGYHFHGARLKAAQDLIQRRLIHQTATEKRRLLPCRAGRLTAVVTETGEVFPCESFRHGLGNLRQAACDLGGMLRGEVGARAREAIRQEKCYCTHECYMMMNILFSPRLYPALLREYFALRP